MNRPDETEEPWLLDGPANYHVRRRAADLWATPLHDLREALADLGTALTAVAYDHTIGKLRTPRDHP